jgi:hypothetical protein
VNIEQPRVHADCHGSGDEKGIFRRPYFENPLSQEREREVVHLQQDALSLEVQISEP